MSIKNKNPITTQIKKIIEEIAQELLIELKKELKVELVEYIEKEIKPIKSYFYKRKDFDQISFL